MRYKVYLAKLKRPSGNPRTVFKIGITSYNDAMDRINYRGNDEPFPITNYFNDNKIMASTKRIYTEEEAKTLERRIMNTIKGNEKYFHNWYEDDKISGITEMRKWNYDEVQKVFELLA
jgi:hypothetical protein